MADAVAVWVGNWFKRGQGARHMILSGKTGVGKTAVANRIRGLLSRLAIASWEAGKWPHIPRIDKVEFGKVCFLDSKEFQNWLAGQSDTDALFVDDIGSEVDRFKTGEPAERLREILEEFQFKFLFITTNLMPEDWASQWDARVSDRLLRNSTVVTMREVLPYTEARMDLRKAAQ